MHIDEIEKQRRKKIAARMREFTDWLKTNAFDKADMPILETYLKNWLGNIQKMMVRAGLHPAERFGYSVIANVIREDFQGERQQFLGMVFSWDGVRELMDANRISNLPAETVTVYRRSVFVQVSPIEVLTMHKNETWEEVEKRPWVT